MKKFKWLGWFALVALCAAGEAGAQAWRTLKAPEGGLRSNYVRALAVSGDLLFAASDKGLSAASFLRSKSVDFAGKKMPPGLINTLRVIGDSLWIGSAAGLGVVHLKSEEASVLPPEETGIGNAVTCIANSATEVWVGTDGGGAFRYDRLTRQWRKFTRKEGLASDNINAVLVERDTVWFGAGDQGVSLYLKSDNRWVNLTRYDGLSHGTVNAIVKMSDRIYFATHQGLSIYDRRLRSFAVKREKEGLADNLLLTAAADGEYLWLAGVGSLTRYSTVTGEAKAVPPSEGVPGEWIPALAVLGNSLFVGTDGNGLYIYNKGFPSASIDALTLSGNAIRITGQAFSMAEKATYQVFYYKPALPDLRFGRGFRVSETGSGVGSLGELDLRDLIDGDYILELLVQTAGGLKNLFKLPYKLDTFDPEIDLEPGPPFTKEPQVEVRGRFREQNVSAIFLYPGGLPAQVDPKLKTFSGLVTLPARGRTLLRAVIYDEGGRNAAAERSVYWAPEEIKFNFDRRPTHVKDPSLVLKGGFSSGAPLKFLTVAPPQTLLSVDTLLQLFTARAELPLEGENTFTFQAGDQVGNTVTEEVKIIFDRTGPQMTLSNPSPCVPDSQIKMEGTLNEPPGGDLYLLPGGLKIPPEAGSARFSFTVKLHPGKNDFLLSATDRAGNAGQLGFSVDRDVVAPRLVPPVIPELVRDAFYTLNGKFDEDNIDRVMIDPGATPARINPGEYGYSVPLKLENGDNAFTVTAYDRAGNSAKLSLTIKARLEDEERVIRVLREEVARLDHKVDSLSRATALGPPSLLITEMTALRHEIERLSREKAEFQGQMEFLKSVLQTGRTVKPEEVLQKLGSGGFDLPRGQIIYIARQGDKLKDVARRFYGDESKTAFLAKFNDVQNPDALEAGRRVVVPVVGDVYVGREEKK